MYDYNKNYRSNEEQEAMMRSSPAGSWVRYTGHKLISEDSLKGVGRVKFWWWYDGLICEVDDFSRKPARLAIFVSQRKDNLEPVGVPTSILEGIGL